MRWGVKTTRSVGAWRWLERRKSLNWVESSAALVEWGESEG